MLNSRKTRLWLGLAILLAVLVVMVAGCPRPAKRPSPARRPRVTDQTRRPTPTPGMVGRIVEIANAHPQVDQSSVVVTGNMALIGLKLKPGVTGTRVPAVEKEVADRVERSERGITRAAVTANPDLVDRIRKIEVGVREGKPVTSFSREITEIVSRLTPRS